MNRKKYIVFNQLLWLTLCVGMTIDIKEIFWIGFALMGVTEVLRNKAMGHGYFGFNEKFSTSWFDRFLKE